MTNEDSPKRNQSNRTQHTQHHRRTTLLLLQQHSIYLHIFFIMDHIQSRPSFDHVMETTSSELTLKRTPGMSDVRTMANSSNGGDSFLTNDNISTSSYFDLRRPAARSSQIPEFIVTQRECAVKSRDGGLYHGRQNEQWDTLTSDSSKVKTELFRAYIHS